MSSWEKPRTIIFGIRKEDPCYQLVNSIGNSSKGPGNMYVCCTYNKIVICVQIHTVYLHGHYSTGIFSLTNSVSGLVSSLRSSVLPDWCWVWCPNCYSVSQHQALLRFIYDLSSSIIGHAINKAFSTTDVFSWTIFLRSNIGFFENY